MMIPQAIDVSADTDLSRLYAYCNSVMEPWDGPAAIAAFSGNWVLGGMDRNGLRPMRYSITKDGMIVAGSETGMVHIPETDIIERGRLGPGEMIGVNLAEGRLFKDDELKQELATRQPWGNWISRAQQMDGLLAKQSSKKADMPDDEGRSRRQIMAGWTMEDMELILQPMAATGKEAVGSMGDDAPLAVLSSGYRGLHLFRQNFRK